MKKRIPAWAFAGAIALSICLVILIGFKTVLREPPSVPGIGRDGKPMTEAQGQAMGMAMSGGRARFPKAEK